MSQEKGWRYHHLYVNREKDLGMPDLDTLGALRNVVLDEHSVLKEGHEVLGYTLYCPRCIGVRRTRMQMRCFRDTAINPSGVTRPKTKSSSDVEDPDDLPSYEQQEEEENDRQERKEHLLRYGMAPSLFVMKCNECDAGFTTVVYAGASGESLAIFPEVPGGIVTPHTPAAVSYYLDQAARAQSVEAMSAAAAMYRAALEHLLEDQGIKGGMLGARIDTLLKKRESEDKNAPPWLYRINARFLNVIKDLGNGAIHTNGGDISLQGHITPGVVAMIQTAFESLLEHVYEAPAREAESVAKLESAASAVTPPKKPRG